MTRDRFDGSAAGREPQDYAGPGQAEPPPEAPEGAGVDEARTGGPERDPQTGADAGPDDVPEPSVASEEVGDSQREMVDDLAKTQQDMAELTADLKRLQAEYVNYKRRVDRDRELVQQNARFAVLSAFLPVLDDLDRAREHGELEGGFKAVADSLERIVAAQGLVKFGKPGDEFDPHFHEALMHAHSPDVETTTCQHVISAGYQIGDRVVRPARVTVVDPEPSGATGQGDEAEGQADIAAESGNRPEAEDRAE